MLPPDSSVTFQCLASGPIWNFSKMGKNLAARLVRNTSDHNLIFHVTEFSSERHPRSPENNGRGAYERADADLQRPARN